MKTPIEISAKDVPVTETLETLVHKHADKLTRFHGRILRCGVFLEGAGKHHRKGQCKVRINLSIPGNDVVITRQSGRDFAVALREAFSAAGRRLEDQVRKTRGQVKVHAVIPEAPE